MPVAKITTEGVVLFLHVLAMLVAFGPTLGYAFFIVQAQANPASMPTVIRGIRAIDRSLGTFGILVLLLAGLYLVGNTDLPWDWDDTFVIVGLVGLGILIAMHFGFFAPRSARLLEIAERDLADGAQLSEEFARKSKTIGMGGQIATLIIVVVIFFMVVKP